MRPRPPRNPQALPQLLEPGALAGVLEELRRLFGSSAPPGRMLQNSPDLALLCQTLAGQSRGERDEDYLADVYTGGGGRNRAGGDCSSSGGGGGGSGSGSGSGSDGSGSSGAP